MRTRLITVAILASLSVCATVDIAHTSEFRDTLRYARQGFIEDQFIVGKMYLHGVGAPQDTEKGAFWLHKAAEQGHVQAQSLLQTIVNGDLPAKAPPPVVTPQVAPGTVTTSETPHGTGGALPHKDVVPQGLVKKETTGRVLPAKKGAAPPIVTPSWTKPSITTTALRPEAPSTVAPSPKIPATPAPHPILETKPEPVAIESTKAENLGLHTPSGSITQPATTETEHTKPVLPPTSEAPSLIKPVEPPAPPPAAPADASTSPPATSTDPLLEPKSPSENKPIKSILFIVALLLILRITVKKQWIINFRRRWLQNDSPIAPILQNKSVVESHDPMLEKKAASPEPNQVTLVKKPEPQAAPVHKSDRPRVALLDMSRITQRNLIELFKDETLIGRKAVPDIDPEGQILIPSGMVSRSHARILFKDKKFWLEDLSSRNGTFLNQKRITTKEHIVNGDLISIDTHDFRFVEFDNEGVDTSELDTIQRKVTPITE